MSKIEFHQWYRQYHQLKQQNPDALLLYRMGDFYELYDDDAKLGAELLELTLARKDYATQKVAGKIERLFTGMAGVPFHAAESYIARLVSQGYRVAIAEQMSETASSKTDTRPRSVFAIGLEQSGKQRGLVHREIVRVLTPGTLIEPSLLATNQNNYLAAVIAQGDAIGFGYADVSTGEFAATEFRGDRAAILVDGELARLRVAEVLVPDEATLQLPSLVPTSKHLMHDLAPLTKQERDMLLPNERVARRIEQEETSSFDSDPHTTHASHTHQNQSQWTKGHITPYATWNWDIDTVRDVLTQHFGVQSLSGFGLDDKPLATRAAGAVLQYIRTTQRASAAHITALRVYTTGSFMFLDPQTRRNLELLESTSDAKKGSLVGVLDHTRTPMGARLLRHWISQPLLDVEALSRRQDAVASMLDDGLMRAEVRQALGDIGDMERVVNRVMQGATVATPRDVVNLRQALRALPTLIAATRNIPHVLHIEELESAAVVQRVVLLRNTTNEPPQPPQQSQQSPQKSSTSGGVWGKPNTTTAAKTAAGQHTRRPAPRVAGDDLFGDDENDDDDDNVVDTMAPAVSPPEESLDETAPPDTADETIREESAPYDDNAPNIVAPDCAPNLALDPCSDVLALLEEALDDDPPALLGASQYLKDDDEKPRRVIRPGYDPRIDTVVRASREAQRYIDTLEGHERDKTGIRSLKVDYNKVFGYYIEVSRTSSSMVPTHYERKQTLVNAERYVTIELKEYESMVLNAQQRLVEYERETFTQVCQQLTAYSEQLRRTARMVARLDVFAALAEVAVRGQYTRPTLTTTTRLHIEQGRHPVVEKTLSEAFVPNDVTLDTTDQQLLLITGPNMAGKSTVLRQVALIVLMAQIGSFVPATYADVGIVDRIFTRIGAQDDLATGQSTFMVEMTETAALLMQSSRRSLIILDEVGRGTSTYDGMAIARAVVEYIHHEPRLGCRTLFATHYHELTDLEHILPRVWNYHMAALEKDSRVVFLYELRRGNTDRSYGIHVAELAGIPRPVIRRATELLAQLEGETNTQKIIIPLATDTPSNDDAHTTAQQPQPSLFDVAPHPVVEYLKRLDVNALTPIEAMTRLYELQKIAQTPLTDGRNSLTTNN